jgi:hypothetical protein
MSSRAIAALVPGVRRHSPLTDLRSGIHTPMWTVVYLSDAVR